jgi:chromosome condensin MukBEF MukE localization factor
MTRVAHATVNDRESRLRRSLRRLGYDLVDAEAGQFYIRHQGTRVHATSDLFGLSLDGVEQWIREQPKRCRS